MQESEGGHLPADSYGDAAVVQTVYTVLGIAALIGGFLKWGLPPTVRLIKRHTVDRVNAALETTRTEVRLLHEQVVELASKVAYLDARIDHPELLSKRLAVYQALVSDLAKKFDDELQQTPVISARIQGLEHDVSSLQVGLSVFKGWTEQLLITTQSATDTDTKLVPTSMTEVMARITALEDELKALQDQHNSLMGEVYGSGQNNLAEKMAALKPQQSPQSGTRR